MHASNGSTRTYVTLEEWTSGHTSGDVCPHLCVTQPRKHPIDASTPDHLNPKPRPRLSNSRTQHGKRRIAIFMISQSVCTGYQLCKTCPSLSSISKCHLCLPSAKSSIVSMPNLQHCPRMLMPQCSKFPPCAKHHHTFLTHSTIAPFLLASKKLQKHTSFKLLTPAHLAMKWTWTTRTCSTSSKFLPLRRRSMNPLRPSCRNSRLQPPPLL